MEEDEETEEAMEADDASRVRMARLGRGVANGQAGRRVASWLGELKTQFGVRSQGVLKKGISVTRAIHERLPKKPLPCRSMRKAFAKHEARLSPTMSTRRPLSASNARRAALSRSCASSSTLSAAALLQQKPLIPFPREYASIGHVGRPASRDASSSPFGVRHIVLPCYFARQLTSTVKSAQVLARAAQVQHKLEYFLFRCDAPAKITDR